MTFSAWSSWAEERCSAFTASASRSKTLTEYQRTRLASQPPEMMAAICASASSTSGEKHDAPDWTLPAWPTATALLTSASRFGHAQRGDLDHGHAQALGERGRVDDVSPLLEQVAHVEAHDHTRYLRVSRSCVVR